jgi:hypothetical protein
VTGVKLVAAVFTVSAFEAIAWVAVGTATTVRVLVVAVEPVSEGVVEETVPVVRP